MPNTVIIGLDAGDEGKGSIVDFLAKEADATIRYNGGSNAGHTVIDENGEKFVTHLIPSSALHNNKIIIARGVVAEIPQLDREEREFNLRGIDIMDNFYVDENTMIVFPFHRILDMAQEWYRVNKLGGESIGTTARGIGPAYNDETNRCAGYFHLFRDKDRLAKHVARRAKETYAMIKHVYLVQQSDFTSFFHQLTEKDTRGSKTLIDLDGITDEELNFSKFLGKNQNSFDVDAIVDEYWEKGLRFAEKMIDLPVLLNEWVGNDLNILFEGAQGRLIGKRDGYPPNTSSSDTVASEVYNGTGYHVRDLNVLGVTKAYPTKVGTHVFPTEMEECELSDKLKKHEFGTTTGRQRMVGWYDLPQARRSQLVNMCDEIVITKIDLLSGAESLKVGMSYRDPENGEDHIFAPRDPDVLSKVDVVYNEVPTWQEDVSSCRDFCDLPKEAQKYIVNIAAGIQDAAKYHPIVLRFVSVGAQRDQFIECDYTLEELDVMLK